jgi:hypothetical protein
VTQVSHYIGLDLGKPGEFSALAVLEGPQRGFLPKGEELIYSLRHLKRWEPGTPYPTIVSHVTQLAAGHPFLGNATLFIDQTGVGRAVIELFRNAPARLVPVVITAGMGSSFAMDGTHHISKVEMIGVVQVLLQTRRLKIASGMRDAGVLVRELDRYREKVRTTDTLDQWRDGDFDDLVLATALACWQAERYSMALAQWTGEPVRRMNLEDRCRELARTHSHRGLFGQGLGPSGE